MGTRRKPPVRTSSEQVAFRITPDEMQLLRDAVAKLEAEGPLGARVSVSSFVQAAALKAAREVLGKR